jgi:CRISPR-associated endonuclease/helicase Cas3
LAENAKSAPPNSSGALSKDRAVMFVLNANDELDFDERGSGRVWTLRRLAELGNKEREREKRAFIHSLKGRTLAVTAYLGGLRDGVLRDDEGAAALSMDTDANWTLRPFRVSETSRLESTVEADWKQSYRFACEIDEDGEATRWLIVDERQGQSEGEEFRAISRNEQKLEDHQEATKKIALGFAKAMGLPPQYAEMLALAARLHDEGKDCWRWQRAFNASPDAPYAKTAGPVNLKLLDGYRHEVGSLLKVEKNPKLSDVSPNLHDLLLHLIAAHHGSARPLISTQNCPDAAANLQAHALQVTLRFERLQKHWGPWGLAWWESLLRAADQRASRENDELVAGESRYARPEEDAR